MKLLLKKIAYPLIKSRPDFLIIGVQRAATTSLYRYLTQHPQIVVTGKWRETYYFDVPDNYNKGLGWYLGHFPAKLSKGNKLTFEASPSYLYYPPIPQRIKQDLGTIKMIAILRNPVDRAYSAWQMYHNYMNVSLAHLRERADSRTFAEAIEQEFKPELNTATYPYNYIDRGNYAKQLENYYQYFNPETILILNFEQFCQDLEANLVRVCDFLNIAPFPQEMIRQFQTEKYAAANYERKPEDKQVLERLKEYYAPENEKLYQTLGSRYDW
jgi:hypothetical protein